MPEHIKLEPLRDEILNDTNFDSDTINYFLSIVDSQPTADVAEINHGQWTEKRTRLGATLPIYACSVCGRAFTFHPNYDFCPGCGADMRKKEGAEK